jgi:predicted MPP superfamily phosphohydrolase
MSNSDNAFRQVYHDIPLVLAQIAIAFTFLQWAKRRFSPRAFTFTYLIVGLAGVLQLVTVVMDLCPWFWPAVRPLAPHFSWMRTTTFLWMLPSSVAFLVFLLYRFLLNRSPQEVNPVRRRLIHTAGAAAMTAPFVAEALGVFIGRLDFETRHVELKVKDLHPDLEGLRILQLSDLHLSAYLSVKELARVIDAANEFKPHVSLMTGDLITTWGDPVDDCLAQLKRVRSDTGMLGCLGNHEAYVGAEEYVRKRAADLGIQFLRHRNQQLRFGNGVVNFGGVDYLPFKMRGRYLTDVAELKAAGALNILLSHNPDVFPEAAAQGWDVTLAGHTHGGQVTIEIFEQTLNPARFYTRYVSGLYQRGDAQCYVTRGIGTIGIPARVGATPEITCLQLRKA